jgi:hypothetical protein
MNAFVAVKLYFLRKKTKQVRKKRGLRFVARRDALADELDGLGFLRPERRSEDELVGTGFAQRFDLVQVLLGRAADGEGVDEFCIDQLERVADLATG